MALKLIVSNKAQRQIINILEFYTERNKSEVYSKRLFRGFQKIFSLLKQRPFIGKKTSIEDVYVMIWGQFYIFYNFTETELNIITIKHQKENVSL